MKKLMIVLGVTIFVLGSVVQSDAMLRSSKKVLSKGETRVGLYNHH